MTRNMKKINNVLVFPKRDSKLRNMERTSHNSKFMFLCFAQVNPTFDSEHKECLKSYIYPVSYKPKNPYGYFIEYIL